VRHLISSCILAPQVLPLHLRLRRKTERKKERKTERGKVGGQLEAAYGEEEMVSSVSTRYGCPPSSWMNKP